MGGLIRIIPIVLLIAAAVILGAILGVILYRKILFNLYVVKPALKLREDFLRQYPGPEPDMLVKPFDDNAWAQWEYLAKQGLAVEYAQGFALPEWKTSPGAADRERAANGGEYH